MKYDPVEVKKLREQHALLQETVKELRSALIAEQAARMVERASLEQCCKKLDLDFHHITTAEQPELETVVRTLVGALKHCAADGCDGCDLYEKDSGLVTHLEQVAGEALAKVAETLGKVGVRV